MKEIAKRLKHLEDRAANKNPGSIIVTFKDGHRERIHPGEALGMSIEDIPEGKIESFQEIEGSYAEVVHLANILLLSGEEDEDTTEE